MLQRRNRSTDAPGTRRTRVLQVIEDLNVGGLERVVVTLCRTIDRDRFDIGVLCIRGSGVLEAELREIGVPVIDIGGSPGRASYFAFRKVAEALRRCRIDAVHTHNSIALFDGFAACRLAGVGTMIHTDHARDFPDKWRYMAAEHVISHFVHRIAAVSEHTKENLVRYEKIAPHRIVTIPNGIDGSRYAGPVDTVAKRRDLGLGEGPVIGLGARLTAQKGIAYLLEALVAVKQRFPGITLLIAGSGELEDELQQRARELGMEGNVRFLGVRLDMPELLQVFDAYVLPSTWEGLPMAILEALAAGCPVVASDVGGIGDVIRHNRNGSLVPARDPAALAHELIRVLSDAALRRRYAEEGRRTFEAGYSAEAMTRRYESLYLRGSGIIMPPQHPAESAPMSGSAYR
jgi:glycosyltransferase involved in cell wall biosynthesis